jgi:tetratricopeptide (TPR) repeat protein
VRFGPASAAICVLVAAVFFAAPPARAESEAESRFSEALALAREDRCDEAVDRFLASHALEPAVGAIAGAAECMERLGRFEAALDAYRKARALAVETQDDRASDLAEHVRVLEQRIPAPLPSGAEAAAPSQGPSVGSTQRKIGVAAGVVGLFGLTVGGALAALAAMKRSDMNERCPDPAACPADRQAEVERLRTTSDTESAVSTVLLVAGGATLVTGVLLFATAPSAASGVTLRARGGVASARVEVAF